MVFLIKSRMESEHLVQELKATKQKLEEALVKEQEVAILLERNRMAREMHDILGHALVLVSVKLEAAQRLQAVDQERANQEFNAVKDLVRQSMCDLRKSLADLRSPAIEVGDKPLVESLQEWAVGGSTHANFKVETLFEPGIEKLSLDIQQALGQVGREALMNVVKHARANRVEVKI